MDNRPEGMKYTKWNRTRKIWSIVFYIYTDWNDFVQLDYLYNIYIFIMFIKTLPVKQINPSRHNMLKQCWFNIVPAYSWFYIIQNYDNNNENIQIWPAKNWSLMEDIIFHCFYQIWCSLKMNLNISLTTALYDLMYNNYRILCTIASKHTLSAVSTTTYLAYFRAF